ncbi:DNA-binding protein WhiA [Streptococcus equi subsp. zooepidemicus]|uniref:Probable cell division protein WhiA n=1 Tax=Streptococcus equi subsp. zooepidemicus (strain H70) TaxID=553483 RepID=C0MHH0_STRS7|nr:DNA-binding protein WhiA [Streptococcus equi]MCD3390722.1 DNA-binding protein WhiA [Streptococcus equi subsp. zooepidemicus]MCD3398711.1 DNA-binding protein WhiA [Streptococcus equi subsp. zooepidemicus]MCD3434100.1 DNA-binding protein WhiA [Streptococcus equi subsp. zooepidemicus]MCD3437528.1 DNA-binding protein WhiA [Streptococcus equi subsp. zooepidemicus]MCD3450935.1 DNA-binding protein WhiA [Streptococcus equi subsp. zooepidemicus]
MSFTTTVKEELIHLSASDQTELSAIIKLAGSLGLANQSLNLSITTENAKIARYIYALIEDTYHIIPEIKYHQKTNLKKNRVYTVYLDKQVDKLLADLKLADSFFGIETGIEQQVMSDDDAGRAYLKGAFLAAGTVRDPESGKYQLEIYSVYLDHAQDLAQLMHKFMLDAKVIERKNGAVTYLQKAEDIMDFLIIIGAMSCKEEFEAVKLLREARNDINRANNAETANIAKTITASMRTINNIIKIMDTIGLDSLPIELQQIAQMRVANPDYSLQQIADSLDFAITKSGVNHRLRKINKLAEDL